MTVAWIAAGASALGAIFAWFSARRANNLADGLDRRRHMIESHDHEVAEFRANFATLVTKLGKVSDLAHMTSALFAAELVFGHPLCTPELEISLSAVINVYTQHMAIRQTPGADFDDLMKKMRADMRAINEDAAARRDVLVTGLTRR